jgi:phosphate transport system substrate-binding protein
MKGHIRNALVCWAVIGTVGILPTNPACGQKLSIAGSTTVLPVVAEAIKMYQLHHPQTQFVLGGGGSGNGIKAASTGAVEIGMSSRPLKDNEMVHGLVPVKIGYDGIVLVVHARNSLQRITSRQVVEIYTGALTNWKQLGGVAAPITLLSTNERHGTFDGFVEHFHLQARPEGQEGSGKFLSFKNAGGSEFSPVRALALDGNEAVLAAMMTKPNSFAYTSLGAALRVLAVGHAPLKMLELDGQSPNIAAVIAGTWPIVRPLQVLTLGPARGEAARFIGFLTGSEGQQIVERVGYIPVAPTKGT